jgi:hypothetical protein
VAAKIILRPIYIPSILCTVHITAEKPGLQKGSRMVYALDLQISDLRVEKEPGHVTVYVN